MPLPKPKKDEEENKWIERCMGNETMKKDFDDNDQRLAVCYQIWKDKDKEEKSMKPNMDEEEQDFMDRCMNDPDMKSKHPGNAGRDNACQIIWDDMGQMDSLDDKTIEKRVFSDMEIRAVEGQPSSLVFYPAVFNSLSEEMWGFREKIMPGAFSKALSMDVRALFNHDPNYVLGRNKANTLTLNEDERGLKAEVIPPDTQWARDLMISVKRGDISQGSFSFKATDEEWDYASIPMQRTIKEAKLYDVSIVTYPAYPQTSIQVRSKIKELRKKPDNEPDPVMQQQRDGETKLKQQFEVLKLRGREINARS